MTPERLLPRRLPGWRAGLLLAALAATMALTACSEEDDATPSPTATATATTATATATTTATATAAPTETATPGATAEAFEIGVSEDAELGSYLVGPTGLTLYLFTNDEAGVSNCSGQCATNWPPLIVPTGVEPTAVAEAPGELGVIDRADGLGRQVTYEGIPLYYWAGDQQPGDTTGQGVGDVWFVVPPIDETTSAAPSTSPGGGSMPPYNPDY